MKLTDEQMACVTSEAKAILCLANPGAGKTRTLTHAIASRILSGEVHHNNVLAITFTRLAARELRERLHSLVPGRCPMIGTFHGICYEIVRAHWRELGYRSEVILVHDQAEQRKTLRTVIERSRHTVTHTSVLDAMDEMARTGTRPDGLTRQVASVLDSYLASLRAENAVDYPIIPYLAYGILKEQGPRLPWRHVFVDEAQDLDDLQHRSVALLEPERVFFVGDPDQLIYGWRGARADLLEAMADQWKAERHVLEVNHRSGVKIIATAGALIAHNRQRVDKAMLPGPDAPEDVVEAIGEGEVAEAIAHSARAGMSCAIMGRTHAAIEAHLPNLRAEGLTINVVSAREKLLEREEVKNVLAILAWPDMPDTISIAERVLYASTTITPIGVAEMVARARRSGTTLYQQAIDMNPELRSFYAEIQEDSFMGRLGASIAHARGGRAGLNAVDERALATVVAEFVRTETLERRTPSRLIAWLNMRDAQVGVVEADIQVLTIHASKGLEFDAVAVVGLEERLLPHKRAMGDEVQMEEERRLMFVAATRARKRLILAVPGAHPSRFLAEMGYA